MAMLALSIQQPWAELIVVGVKMIEVRTWRPRSHRLGELIAIHASRKPDRRAPQEVWDAAIPQLIRSVFLRPQKLRLGGIVGVARLVGLRDYSDRDFFVHDAGKHLNPLEWWGPRLWGFEFAEARRFEDVIPCRGALGFWSVPPDVEARIRRMLADSGTQEAASAADPAGRPELGEVERGDIAPIGAEGPKTGHEDALEAARRLGRGVRGRAIRRQGGRK